MIQWEKPDGRVVETNDLPANVEAALNAGWRKVEIAPKQQKKKQAE